MQSFPERSSIVRISRERICKRAWRSFGLFFKGFGCVGGFGGLDKLSWRALAGGAVHSLNSSTQVSPLGERNGIDRVFLEANGLGVNEMVTDG